MSDTATKLTLRLTPEARVVIENLSRELGGITAAEVIRRSLGTEKFLLDEQRKGNKILVEDARGDRQREIVFR